MKKTNKKSMKSSKNAALKQLEAMQLKTVTGGGGVAPKPTWANH